LRENSSNLNLVPFLVDKKCCLLLLPNSGELAKKLGSLSGKGGGFWGITRVFPATPPFKISTDDYSSS
jgi:hypothetical protein